MPLLLLRIASAKPSRQVLSKRFKRGKRSGIINLRQVNMMVHEYGLKFTQLSRYASHMVDDSKAQMNKFLYGV